MNPFMNPTIRMSDIPRVWSPEPGPAQRTTGLKTLHGEVYGVFRESLSGLHETAWWTGLQLKCPDAPGMEFYVRLLSDIGIEHPFGPSAKMDWFQKEGDWQPLPWAITPSLATCMRLYLEITPIGRAMPLWIARRIGFHELGDSDIVSREGRYVFVNVDGQICATWDTRFSAWATKGHGHVPHWGSAYYVVPPLRDYLFNHSTWTDKYHNLLHWEESIEMPLRSLASPGMSDP